MEGCSITHRINVLRGQDVMFGNEYYNDESPVAAAAEESFDALQWMLQYLNLAHPDINTVD